MIASIEHPRSGLTGRASLVFNGDRAISVTLDYVSGRVTLDAGEAALSADDIANLARLQIALHVGKGDLQLGEPRHVVDGLINFIGMQSPGVKISSFNAIFSALAVYDVTGGRFLHPTVSDRPPADEPDVEVSSAVPDLVAMQNSWFARRQQTPVCDQGDASCVARDGTGGSTNTLAPSVWLTYPDYTGAKIGTGGNDVRCISEGYYYAIGFDWQKNIFGSRHVYNMWSPTMPRNYAHAQATARGGLTCNGLVPA